MYMRTLKSIVFLYHNSAYDVKQQALLRDTNLNLCAEYLNRSEGNH